MSTRFAKAGLLAAGLLLVALLSPTAAEPLDLPQKADAGRRPERSKQVLCTYPVADLVIPIDDSPRTLRLGEGSVSCIPDAPKARPKTLEKQLIQLITRTVAPQSWSEKGGPGTIDYGPQSMTLFINQTEDVQQQVADLLTALRRRLNVEVALEVRILTVPETLCERIGVDFSTGKAEVMHTPGSLPDLFKHLNISLTSGSAKLTARQATAFLEAIQADPQSSVLQAPKVTVFNGQRIATEITDRMFVFAGMNVERKPNGEVIAHPRTEPITTGLRLCLQPVVSTDRRGVEVDMAVSCTELDSPSGAQDTRRAGKCCEGKELPPAPERQARLTTHTLRRVARLPDGGTLVVDNGVKLCACAVETRTPVLGNIPYVSRLFRNVGYQRMKMHQLVLVTPRIIVFELEELHGKEVAQGGSEEQEAIPSMTPREKQLTKLLQRYHEACTAGRLNDAQKLAARALAIDPACFSKTGK